MSKPVVASLLLIALAGVLVVAWLAHPLGFGASASNDSSSTASPQAAAAPAELAKEDGATTAVPKGELQRTAAVETAGISEDGPPSSVDASAPVQRLRVRVTRADDHRPIEGCDVRLDEPVDPRSSEARFSATLTTEVDGRVTFEPPAGRGLYLVAGENYRRERRSGEPEVGHVMQQIEPLLPGEERELVLELPVGEDLVFWLRTIAQEGREPIAGAKVRLREGTFRKTPRSDVIGVSDAAGFVQLRACSWKRMEFQLEADGYASVEGRVRHGHETREQARVIPMKRAAALEVHVLERGVAPSEAVVVRLTTPWYEVDPDDESGMLSRSDWVSEDPVWTAKCDARGICGWTTLPPHARLTATVSLAGRADWRAPEPILLQPGESRSVTWDVGIGTRLVITLLDQEAAPIVGRALWLTSKALGCEPRPGSCYFYKGSEDEVLAVRTTGADGRAVFDTVPGGRWWVGPGQTEYSSGRDSHGVAAVGGFVEIADGGRERALELRVDRGLAIRGKVLGPDGEPVDHAWLRVTHESICGFLDGKTLPDGTFVIGPVARGRHSLVAHTMDTLDSSPVEALAGSSEVVLRLQSGATVRGQVYDLATGAHVFAFLTYGVAGGEDLSAQGSHPDGTFEHSGLATGTYHISAVTEDGRIGIAHDIELTEGSTREGVRIGVAPGAWVRVEYHGVAEYAQFTLLCDGASVGADGLARGTRAKHAVRAGHVVVRMQMAPDRVETRELDIAVGETKDVVFRFD